MSLWLVAYAIRSETATVRVIEAESEQAAVDAVVEIEAAGDEFLRTYLPEEFEAGKRFGDGYASVRPVAPGLVVNVDVEH